MGKVALLWRNRDIIRDGKEMQLFEANSGFIFFSPTAATKKLLNEIRDLFALYQDMEDQQALNIGIIHTHAHTHTHTLSLYLGIDFVDFACAVPIIMKSFKTIARLC